MPKAQTPYRQPWKSIPGSGFVSMSSTVVDYMLRHYGEKKFGQCDRSGVPVYKTDRALVRIQHTPLICAPAVVDSLEYIQWIEYRLVLTYLS